MGASPGSGHGPHKVQGLRGFRAESCLVLGRCFSADLQERPGVCAADGDSVEISALGTAQDELMQCAQLCVKRV